MPLHRFAVRFVLSTAAQSRQENPTQILESSHSFLSRKSLLTLMNMPPSSDSFTPAPDALRQVVLASHNAGKLREFAALLAPVGIELIAQDQLGIPSADEPYLTFVENALAKARHASRASGLPSLADDSGLCVDALAGAPGIHSARWAQMEEALTEGETADLANLKLLLAKLDQQPNRRAHYMCVLVFIRHADDPAPIIVEGRWYGTITHSPRGENGFGYDPVFYLAEFDKTAAELEVAVKNKYSHRALAFSQLLERLKSNG